MVALVNSFDSPGFFARNIDDLILATSISSPFLYVRTFLIDPCCVLDAVAGPDGEDSTLSQQTFQPFKTSTDVPTEKRKIIIGLPDVSNSE